MVCPAAPGFSGLSLAASRSFRQHTYRYSSSGTVFFRACPTRTFQPHRRTETGLPLPSRRNPPGCLILAAALFSESPFILPLIKLFPVRAPHPDGVFLAVRPTGNPHPVRYSAVLTYQQGNIQPYASHSTFCDLAKYFSHHHVVLA